MQRIVTRKFFRAVEHQMKALIPADSLQIQSLPLYFLDSRCKLLTSSSRINYLRNAIQNQRDGSIHVKESSHRTNSGKQKKQSLLILCDTFDLSEDEENDMIRSYPDLHKELLLQSLSYLEALGLQKATFMRYPWLPTLTLEDIKAKLKIINERCHDLGDVNVGAALLNMPAHKLSSTTKAWQEEAAGSGFPSKFHYLVKVLEIKLDEVMYLAHLKPFLFTLNHQTLTERISLCLEGGIQKGDLIRNMHVLRTVSSKLRDRIEILKQRNVPAKPWLLSAPQSSFETYLSSYSKTLACMEEHPNIESLLATRLNCDISQIEKMITKHPAVNKVSPAKLKATLDYLLIDKKIDPTMIVMRPEILRHKLETIKERIERLEALGVNYLSLWILSTRDKTFEDYAKRWGRENK